MVWHIPMLAALAFMTGAPPTIMAQSKPIHLGTITGIGGPGVAQPLCLATSDSLLYIGTVQGLHIYEVSNPGAPQFVAHQEMYPSGGGLLRILLRDSLAYLASVGLRIVDVSDPAKPVNLGYVDDSNGGTNGLAMDLALIGSYLLLANGGDGLRVYDVSNPYAPESVGHWPNVPNVIGSFPQSISVSGSYAYLANYGDGLRVFDVSNPADPICLRSFPEPGARQLVIEGEKLYLLSEDLSIYDISFPAKPVRLGGNTNLPGAASIRVLGNYAYIACSGYNFFGPYMYDVSDSANLLRISPRDDLFNEYLVRDMAVSSRFAFLALPFGVSMFDLGTPVAPQMSASLDNSRTVRISWAAPSWRYALEGTTNLESGDWRPVSTGPAQTAGGRNSLSLEMKGQRQSYRLKLN